jgi:hypothetical protein
MITPKANENEPLTVTVAQARKISGLGTTTIYDHLKHGRLKGKKVGGRRLIYYRSIKELVGLDILAA